MIPNDSTFARFYAKLPSDVSPAACWPWQGARSPKGYGFFYFAGRNSRAHRASYEMLIVPIPEGLTIDHLCRNTGCVNPSHLELVTNKENVLRGVGPTAVNARKTRCPKGHPLSGDNLRLGPIGQRNCRTCCRNRIDKRGKRREPPAQKPHD